MEYKDLILREFHLLLYAEDNPRLLFDGIIHSKVYMIEIPLAREKR